MTLRLRIPRLPQLALHKWLIQCAYTFRCYRNPKLSLSCMFVLSQGRSVIRVCEPLVLLVFFTAVSRTGFYWTRQRRARLKTRDLTDGANYSTSCCIFVVFLEDFFVQNLVPRCRVSRFQRPPQRKHASRRYSKLSLSLHVILLSFSYDRELVLSVHNIMLLDLKWSKLKLCIYSKMPLKVTFLINAFWLISYTILEQRNKLSVEQASRLFGW